MQIKKHQYKHTDAFSLTNCKWCQAPKKPAKE